MKLSEAILKGCKIAPIQCKEVYVDGPGSACAIGAALLAVGIDPMKTTWSQIKEVFNLPDGFCLGDIFAENDKGTPREQIANMLAEAGL